MNVFSKRIRGFRLVDLVGMALLAAIILGVYLFKTVAGRERTEIATVDREIAAEKARIRLLTAEVAHLEQPGRIERLSAVYLGLTPVTQGREASLEKLPALAAAGPPVKDKAVSAVAALESGAGIVPGVPPPAPVEAQPVRLAEARTQ
jgi:hypothetical protein